MWPPSSCTLTSCGRSSSFTLNLSWLELQMNILKRSVTRLQMATQVSKKSGLIMQLSGGVNISVVLALMPESATAQNCTGQQCEWVEAWSQSNSSQPCC